MEIEYDLIKEENYKLFTDFLLENFKDHYTDYSFYVDKDDFDEDYTADDLYYAIEDEQGFDEDIIYFYNAMEFLSENDNSLKESLNLAAEYDYQLTDLSSEVLASLLASNMNKEKYPKDEIQDFLDTLEWEREEEEDNDDL